MKSRICRCFAVTFFIHFFMGNVLSKVAEDVPCQLIDDIEEADPVNRNLDPTFYRVKKCKGGRLLRRGHQCQAVDKEWLKLNFLNIQKQAFELQTFSSAKRCKEVCVCGKCIGPPQNPVCERGFRWDAKECRCVCDNGNFDYQRGSKQPKGVSLQIFVISIIAACIPFASVAIIGLCICYKRGQRRKYRYRYLRKVHWNKDQERRLNDQLDYVDGTTNKSTFCCFPRSKPKERPLLENEDAVDGEGIQRDPNTAVLTAVQCFEIGFNAYKADKYELMLKLMKEAEQKLNRGERLPDGVDPNVFKKDLYQYLSIAYIADKSWDLETADKYKKEAIRLHRRDIREHAGQNGGTNMEDLGSRTTEEPMNANTIEDMHAV